MSANLTVDDTARVIALVRGMTDKGGFYWCYVAVKPSRYEEFKTATANRYNIQNFVSDGYGEVVVSAEGRDPSSDVVKLVAEKFGVSVESLTSGSDPLSTINEHFKKIS